jgi:hypothetical protein
MEKLMALQKYVRQLRPIQEKYAPPLIKVENLLKEVSDSEVDFVMKSISGNIAEAVYEAWAFIVAKTSSSKTLPTIKDVESSMSDSEFDGTGKKWITDFLKKTKDNTYLLKAMELVGGDIKDIPNVNWGKVIILHKSIKTYYKNIPKNYKEGAKENTADMVLITKGSVNSLLKSLPNSTMSWTDDGRISIEGTDIEFIQVSLKKGQDSARIGKLSSLINKIYGQQAMRPRQLVGEDIEQLEEGLRDIFGKASELISMGAKKLINFAKNMLTKLKNSLLKSAIKISKTITRDKAHTSSKNLSKLFGVGLSESLNEAKPLPPVKINAPMLKEMKILKNEIIKKDLANAEYDMMLKNVALINSKKEGAIKVINKGTDPKLEMKNFIRAANSVLNKRINDTISREEINPAFKLVVNYASYRTFNTILSDMYKNIESYNKISNSLVSLNAKLRAEAIFGDTALPLWIVYGQGAGAHYKHTKNEFETSTREDIVKLGESMDVPYMYISISKSSKNPTYNAIYLYVLIGSIQSNEELKPEYMMIQFINRSGSDWSYKIDASNTIVGTPK